MFLNHINEQIDTTRAIGALESTRKLHNNPFPDNIMYPILIKSDAMILTIVAKNQNLTSESFLMGYNRKYDAMK